MKPLNMTLSYVGNDADENQIDFYDVAQALSGFQRTLAITTHFVLNGEIITQAPSLKNAQILAVPPEEGSWKFTAVVLGGMYALGTASQDTPIGHLIASAYDYVISESLGFHVDFDKTLGQQYEEIQKANEEFEHLPSKGRFDSIIEKCEPAIKEMHRPIYQSESARSATILYQIGSDTKRIQQELNIETYGYLAHTREEDRPSEFVGSISSYNINTYKGRVFLEAEKRPVPFELADSAKTARGISLVTHSLVASARDRMGGAGKIRFEAFRRLSKTGRLKSLYVTSIIDK